MSRQIPTEVLIERIRKASVNGVAPSSQQLSPTYKQLRKRGIEWHEAIAMAGVKPRKRGRPPRQHPWGEGWVIGEIGPARFVEKPRRRWWHFGRAKAA